MSVELATAWVSIVPSTKGMAGQLQKEFGDPLEDQGSASGNGLAAAFSGAAAKGLKIAGGAAIAGFGASLVSGFNRLQAIDDARFKLAGLGHDAETVDAIMENALGSVLGTAFGLGDAATIAAGAVAAGIEPGERLERTLSLTGDAATIAGTNLDEMGGIFNKVAAANRLSMLEVNQLALRGVPIMQWLAEEYGVTADEARDMVSRGEVDFATFEKVIEDNIGGAALTAGESFRGSLANMGAAIGRFGAAILGPAFARAPDVFANITDRVDALTDRVQPLGEFMARNAKAFGIAAGVIAAAFLPIMAMVVVGWVTSAAAAVKSAVVQVAASWRVVAGWVAQSAAAVASAARTAGTLLWLAGQYALLGVRAALAAAKVVAGWVLMGIQSLIGAAKMAAAWIIAMGPVGWVIAGVVALVALIVANWDKVSAWTKKAWSAVSSAVSKAWTAVTGFVSRGVASVVNFFRNLGARIRSLATAVLRFYVNIWRTIISTVVGAVTGFVSRVVGFFTSIRDRISSAAQTARARVVAAFVQLVTGVRTRVTSLVTLVTGIPGRILRALGNTGRMLFDAGKNILRGMLDGIRSMFGNIGSTMRDAASRVRDFLPFSPAKEGPLSGRGHTLFAGRAIADDLAEGISARSKVVAASAAQLAAMARDQFDDGLPVTAPAMSSPPTARFGPSAGAGSQTIIVELDGRQIARSTLKHAPGVVKVKTGLRA